jgi:hypothetical protein
MGIIALLLFTATTKGDAFNDLPAASVSCARPNLKSPRGSKSSVL